MDSPVYLLAIFITGYYISPSYSATVSSCPAYGCRPSGTFSVLLKLTSSQPKVIWNTTYGPIPDCLGCVANINNIICPYKGLRLDGYVSIDSDTGKEQWYDGVLHDPSLPVLDIEGDVIGTDGHFLVKYESDGTLDKPSIPISSFLYPLYSTTITDNGFLFFASKVGILFAYGTDGIVLASIPLSGSVERANGTFIPVTTPIVVGSRAYILTEFRPEEDSPESRQPHILGMQRLYAVDIIPRMVDRLHIAWYVNFEREQRVKVDKPMSGSQDPLSFDMNKHRDAVDPPDDDVLRFKPNPPSVEGNPLIMADSQRQIIYVILPPPEGASNDFRMFWAIKDNGNDTTMLYKRAISAVRMAMYEVNGLDNAITTKTKQKKEKKLTSLLTKGPQKVKRNNGDDIPVWLLSESLDKLYKFTPTNGAIGATFNLTSLLNGKVIVTSDIMVTRDSDDSTDNIIVGVSVGTTDVKNYVISIDTSSKINWMVPTPSNVMVTGQIAGIAAEGTNSDDMFVAFGQSEDKESSVVFGIK